MEIQINRIKLAHLFFSKKSNKMIERKTNGFSFPKIMNGNLFRKGDKSFKFIDSLLLANNVKMRNLGLYPIDEKDSILISKIKSGCKDIIP